MHLRLLLLLGLTAVLPARAQTPGVPNGAIALQSIAAFSTQQVTGIAVSHRGRVFVNFPDWSDDHGISVAEIVNGKPQPYPNQEWNSAGSPKDHFVCVQSVYVDESDMLWVLDPAAPKMKEIVPGGPKLVKIDLVKNEVVQTIPFDEKIAPPKSYLNDVRVDVKMQTAYLTDSGLGAIVVVDLATGKARRLLDDDPSTRADKDFHLEVEGRKLLTEKGEPPQINSDGIALDATAGMLYFHALTGRILYRVPTKDLRDSSLTKSKLSAAVERITETPPPDGMALGPDGKIYLTDIEHSAINIFDPGTKKVSTLTADGRLRWPDSLAFGPQNTLYVTASQIENMPRFNNGKSTRTTPYQVFKIPNAVTMP
jgi:sugar lactone lactonase YvrE